MKRRGLVLTLLGAVAVALVLVMFSRGSGTTVCPAVGYAYVGDVELVFPQEPVLVAACFGEGCTPAAVTKSPDGKWLVPQSKPYLLSPVSVTTVYVEASASSGAPVARELPIVMEPTGEYPYGRGCGGPFRVTPVPVPLD